MQYEVTIGIPVYRAAGYIEKTMESALSQTFPSIEFLVLDDCGGDGSMSETDHIPGTSGNKNSNQVTDQANFIWNIANKLRGAYMPDKYGDVIIPQAVFDEVTVKDDSACHTIKTLDWINVRSIVSQDDRRMYKAKLHAGEVEVMIYADAETIEGSKDSVKKAFDDFMKNKNDYLKMCQNDVVDKLLPYIKANNTVENRVSDIEISEEDFYADYSLSDVYIIACEYMNEIQITFKSDNGKDEISVHRDLESDCIIDFYDGINVFYSDDMGL